MGFMIVDGIGTANGAVPTTNSRLKCDFSKFTYRGKTIMLVKPMTYMNPSGECLVAVRQWFKLPISSFIVVHDDARIAAWQTACAERWRRRRIAWCGINYWMSGWRLFHRAFEIRRRS